LEGVKIGFSLTGTHVIFFVASVIVAGVVSGVFVAVTNDASSSLSERGDRIRNQLDTEFRIINDNENIPTSGGYYNFYIKNIGANRLLTTNDTFQVFIDGEYIAVAHYYFSSESVRAGDVVTLYIADSQISAGDHTIRLVGPLAITTEFHFTI
jgi:archaeal flagellar protein FlaG